MEQRLILFDTTELLTPAPQKLHAALAELGGSHPKDRSAAQDPRSGLTAGTDRAW